MSPVCTTRSTRACAKSSTIVRTFARLLCVSLTTPMRTASGRLLEDVDRAGAAEADHVREAELRALDLAFVRLAPQVRRHLVDVGDAGRAERVPLREQTTGDVHRNLAAECDGAAVDHLTGFTVLAQTGVLVVQDLGGREAVVALGEIEVFASAGAFFSWASPAAAAPSTFTEHISLVFG